MDVAAKVTSKGQVTIPLAVREALGISEGDSVVFRVSGDTATVARTAGFLDLAGTIEVPSTKRNAAWGDVLRGGQLGPTRSVSVFVDTNVLVRHLTGDPPDMAERATAFLAPSSTVAPRGPRG